MQGVRAATGGSAASAVRRGRVEVARVVRLLIAVALLGLALLVVVLVGQGMAAAAELASAEATTQQRPTAAPAPPPGSGGDDHRGATVPVVLAPLPDTRLRVAGLPVVRAEGDDDHPGVSDGVALTAAARQAPAPASPGAVQVASASRQGPITSIARPVQESSRALVSTMEKSIAGQRLRVSEANYSSINPERPAQRVVANVAAAEVWEVQRQPEKARDAAIAAVKNLEQIVVLAESEVAFPLWNAGWYLEFAARVADKEATTVREVASRSPWAQDQQDAGPDQSFERGASQAGRLSGSIAIAHHLRASLRLVNSEVTKEAYGPFRDRAFSRQVSSVQEQVKRFEQAAVAPDDAGAQAALKAALSGLQDLTGQARKAGEDLQQKAEAVFQAAENSWQAATEARSKLNAPPGKRMWPPSNSDVSPSDDQPQSPDDSRMADAGQPAQGISVQRPPVAVEGQGNTPQVTAADTPQEHTDVLVNGWAGSDPARNTGDSGSVAADGSTEQLASATGDTDYSTVFDNFDLT